MTLQTKFDIGNEVYCKIFTKIYKVRIVGVKFIQKRPIVSVEYYVVKDNSKIARLIDEQFLFLTKEELLKSL